MLFSTTIISRSCKSILSRLNLIKSQHASSPSTLLFALSSPSNSSELSALVDTLMAFSPSSVGCLSAPLAAGYISCSVALLDSKRAVTFRSTIAGQEKPQVGRWHAFRRKDERKTEDIDWPEGAVDWNNLWKTSSKGKINDLPGELLALNSESVSSVMYFSDLSPEGLSSAISEAFPGSNQLGFLASSTPFITGRPVTLFHNQQIYDSGAVGIALTGRTRALEFRCPDDIESLGDPLDVTDSEGNLVNSLNFSNPTQMLLTRIRDAGIDTQSAGAISFKDEMEFYLGVLPQSGLDSSPYQLHAITAGDPSRGTLSLNTQTMAPAIGARVQFFHRRSPVPSSLMSWSDASLHSGGIALTATSPESAVGSGDGHYASEELVLENRFVAGSENGFVLRRTGEYPWTCTAAGSISQIA